MGIVQDRDKADRAIKDAQIRLNTVKTNLDAIQKEIDTLLPIEATLEENVKFLKKTKVIALADEFRKAKAELAKTRIRLTILQNDRERFRKAFSDVEIYLAEAIKKYKELADIGDNNVVRGKFGRKIDG